jgi:acyl-CoA synthetase (NDP forming)
MTGRPPEDLHRLFAPRSIAVIGASNTPGKLGYRVSQRLAAAFEGELHLVNPREALIHGRPGCRDLGAVSATSGRSRAASASSRPRVSGARRSSWHSPASAACG